MPRKTKTGKGKKYGRTRNKSRKNKSRRYRGGCEKCNQATNLSTSTDPMVRGGSHDQINQSIYNYKTDPYFYSSS
jgi:hypothetical protein